MMTPLQNKTEFTEQKLLDRLSAGQDEEGTVSSPAETLSQMQKAHQCQTARCSCQVFVFKSTADVCGHSALYLRNTLGQVEKQTGIG